MRIRSNVLALLLFVGALSALTGCRLWNLGGEDAPLPAVLTGSEGSAQVRFKILLPTAAGGTGTPSTAVRAATGMATVTFRLVLINAGNSANPRSVLTRTASVSTAGFGGATLPAAIAANSSRISRRARAISR